MKKYSKPVLSMEILSNVNERIFLLGSDWESSGCYNLTNLQKMQWAGEGFNQFTFQVDVVHHGDHTNTGQDWIFWFSQEIPPECTGMTFENQPIEFVNYGGVTVGKVHATSWPWQNPDDNIGSGAFSIYFTYEEGTDATYLNSVLGSLEISDIVVNDTKYR